MVLFVVMTPFGDYEKLNFIGPKLMIEECAGEKCLLAHFTQLSWDEVQQLDPSAIVFGGGTTPPAENHGVLDNEEIKRIMREWPKPQLAVCYSAQLSVLYGGGRVEAIGSLEPGEPDPNPHYQPGMKKEYGVYPVEITRESELFSGLGSTIMVCEEHALEIKELPPGYTPLARSALCAVQAYRVEGRPFFGVQFHPEKRRVAGSYGDGAQVLRNFFTMAKRQPR